jgi:hypothetical protein
MLGYQPVVSIDEGMACVEDWLRSEGLFDRSKSGWIEPIRLADNASHWSRTLVFLGCVHHQCQSWASQNAVPDTKALSNPSHQAASAEKVSQPCRPTFQRS